MTTVKFCLSVTSAGNSPVLCLSASVPSFYYATNRPCENDILNPEPQATINWRLIIYKPSLFYLFTTGAQQVIKFTTTLYYNKL